MRISTKALIPASLGTAWGTLVDFPRYRSWRPLVEIEGQAKEGVEVDYFYRNNVEVPRGMSMKATITILQPTREIRMEMGVKGIATMEERYLLIREGTRVRVIHDAEVKGVLPLLAGQLFRKRLTQKSNCPSIGWRGI